MVSAMSDGFTSKERDFIRMEFMDRGNWTTSFHQGIILQRWGSGPYKGKPKLKKAVQSMLDRGLVKIIEPEGRMPYVQFTSAGIKALREMARNRTFLKPSDRYSTLIKELQEL
jgi:hypothetical protein